MVPLLAAALLAARAESIPPANYELKLENYELHFLDFTFPSGLRVLFQEDHSQPIVSVVNVIDVGSEMDPPGMEGVAHVIEHLAFRARHEGLPKNWDLLHQLGASINAYTNVDETLYATVAPVDALPQILRIEALRLADTVEGVTEEDVEAEKLIVRNELRQSYENAAVGEGWDELNRQLFPEDWSYHRSTIGSHDTISNIDLATVQRLTREHYTPANSTIVVVGDFDIEKAQDYLMQAFGDHPELLRAPGAPPDAPLELVAPKPRVQCDARPEPPMPTPDAEPPRVKGMVDHETVLLAWSLPGGYCEDEMVARFAANQLTWYIYRTLVPTWQWEKDEWNVEGIGCFVDPGRTASTLVCYIEPSASGGYQGERLISKAADALYLQWQRNDPMYEKFAREAYHRSKMFSMVSVFQTVDLVSSLFSGRAFDAAKSTHYTADPRYYSRTFNEIAKVTPFAVQEFARRYITRDRMVSVIVEPLDEEERARREAAAKRGDEKRTGYAAETRERQYEYAFDFSKMTDDDILRVAAVPDRSKMREFTLDNGLRVIVMPHGEAPLAHAGLLVHGSDLSAPDWGFDSFAEAVSMRGLGKRERELAVAATMHEWPTDRGREIVISGSSGNLEALLHSLRWRVGDFEWFIADKRSVLKRYRSEYIKAGEHPDEWATRVQFERLFGPDHPLGRRPDAAFFDHAREEWGLDDVRAWILRKYQPANATLVIVGKVDPDQAEELVRRYFGGWKAPAGAGDPIPYEPVAAHVPERQVLVFDKPTSTQTRVVLMCPLAWHDASGDAAAQVMSDVLDEQAWRRLREEKGVTYGAGAWVKRWPGGSSVLGMSTLVQNDATGFAVATFFDLLQRMRSGEVDPTQVMSHKWSRARRYVLGQQSGEAMLGRLLGRDDMGYFEQWRRSLAAVRGSEFPKLLEDCVGHEVVTLVGPREYAERLLSERGISYEVVDWEALQESLLTEKELKKRRKRKEKEAREKEGTSSSDEG